MQKRKQTKKMKKMKKMKKNRLLGKSPHTRLLIVGEITTSHLASPYLIIMRNLFQSIT